MLSQKWNKRIATVCSLMFVLMLLFSTLSVTAFAAETGVVATATESTKASYTTGWIIARIVLLVMCVCLMCWIMSLKKTHRAEIEKLQYKYNKLGNLLRITKENLGYAETDIAGLEAWQESAMKVYPDIQSKIIAQQNQSLADQFVQKNLKFELKEANTVDRFVMLTTILKEYNALDPNVRCMVNADMNYLQQLYMTTTDEYISEAMAYLVETNRTCKPVVDDLETLKAAITYYEALPAVVKKAIQNRLIGKIREKAASAELHLSPTKDEKTEFSFKGWFENRFDDDTDPVSDEEE